MTVAHIMRISIRVKTRSISINVSKAFAAVTIVYATTAIVVIIVIDANYTFATSVILHKSTEVRCVVCTSATKSTVYERCMSTSVININIDSRMIST